MGDHTSTVRTTHTKHDNTKPRTKPRGRRALPPPITDPVNTGLVAVAAPITPGFRKVALTTLTAGALLAGAGVAHASAPKDQRKAEAPADALPETPTMAVGIPTPEVVAPAEPEQIVAEVVELEAPKVEVAVVEAPAPVKVEPAVISATKAAPPAPVVAPKVAVAPVPAAEQAPAPAAVAPSGRAEAIVNAARAQIGRAQDCTMLVTNALAAVGIKFHGWPHEYYSLGYAVSAAEAMPGDLIYYANGGGGMAHIALYIGNGRAIHGGYNGNQTIEWTANVPAPATAAQYIRLR